MHGTAIASMYSERTRPLAEFSISCGPSIKSPGLAAGRILILDRRNPIRSQRVADNRVPTFRIGGSPQLARGYFPLSE